MSAATSSPEHYDSMLLRVWDYEHPGTGEVVYNVEGLCRKVLNRLAGRLPRQLEPRDYDESLAHLLGEVVVLAEVKYDPSRSSGLGGFLSVRLPLALIDHWRMYHGPDGGKRVIGQGGGEVVGTIGEPVDESLEARVEDFVLGYVDLLPPVAIRGADRASTRVLYAVGSAPVLG